MSERRSPYLVLGIDYGANAAAAAAAFARVSKRVRRDPDAPYSMEDVTWALHSIEQADGDPESSVDTFRVPADPSVYPDATLDDLLPATPPMARATPAGSGRRAVEAHAVASELVGQLGALAGDMLAPPPPPHDPVADAAASNATASTEDFSGVLAGIFVSIIILALIGIAANSASRNSSRGNAGSDPATSAHRNDDADRSAPDATWDPWVERGGCLRAISATSMEPTPCGGHDGEIFAVHEGARSGEVVCPSATDVWFDDEWGVYCALIVSDDASEGGHWGIGPIHDDSCVEIDRSGRLVDKRRCDSRAVPVLTTARSPDGCDVPFGRGDGYYYFGASDGTSNYVCIDSADWDAAGLPSG